MMQVLVIQYLSYQTKSMIVTPRCKHVLIIPDNVIEVVNQIGEDDGSPDEIVFRNIYK